MTTNAPAEAVQAASAALAGVAAQYWISPEVLGVLLVCMLACSLADTMAPALSSRRQLAVRYIASVGTAYAASYVAAAAVAIYWPDWRGHLLAAQVGAAVLASLVMHPLIALLPGIGKDLWIVVIGRVRGTAGGGS